MAVQKESPEQRQENGMRMDQMAQMVERHHQTPAPNAADLLPNPFPSIVIHGLWISAVVGAVLGLLVGWLLYNNIVVVDGWEQIYSVGDVSFYTLWAGIGIALGVIVGGIATIALSPAESLQSGQTPQNREATPDSTDREDGASRRDRSESEDAAARDPYPGRSRKS